jgi:hypothetical protein
LGFNLNILQFFQTSFEEIDECLVREKQQLPDNIKTINFLAFSNLLRGIDCFIMLMTPSCPLQNPAGPLPLILNQTDHQYFKIKFCHRTERLRACPKIQIRQDSAYCSESLLNQLALGRFISSKLLYRKKIEKASPKFKSAKIHKFVFTYLSLPCAPIFLHIPARRHQIKKAPLGAFIS